MTKDSALTVRRGQVTDTPGLYPLVIRDVVFDLWYRII